MRHLLYISALAVLLLIACATPSERRRMVAALAEADSMNRHYVPFTTDSVLLRVTEFYDRHGTDSDRIRAHYLLGCAYRDLGEAPQALVAYQDAIDLADTTRTDCNYQLLARIHGQMGTLFQQQALYRNALREYQIVEHFALKAKDTLMSVLGFGQMASCYYNLGLKDSALIVSEQTRNRLNGLGHTESANSFLSQPILILLEKGKYQQAKDLLDEYENHSTLSHREAFRYKNYYLLYYYKGLYYLGVNRPDSAIPCFRQLIAEGTTINNHGLGYSGLFDIYTKTSERDSIVKYAVLYKSTVDSIAKTIEGSRLQNIQGLYDYQRHQQIASNEKQRAIRLNHWLTICIILSLALVVITSLAVLYIRSVNNRRVQIITSRYVLAVIEYHRLKNEMAEINRNRKQAGHEIEDLQVKYTEVKKEYERAKALIASMQEDKKMPEEWNLEDSLLDSAVVQKFHKMASVGATVSSEDWNLLRKTVSTTMPQFMEWLFASDYQLNAKETNLCILIRLRFIPSELCNLLGISINNLGNIRKRLLKKVFGIDGSARRFDELIQMYQN